MATHQNPAALDRFVEVYSELHPDLADCLDDDGDALFVYHPLVHTWPYDPQKLNAQYEGKQRQLNQLLPAKNYERAIWLYERPYRLGTLYEWVSERRLRRGLRLRALLAKVWKDTEYPHQFDQLPLLSFAVAGYTSDVDTPLPRRLTVWRGASGDYPAGISWTATRAVAEKFARRFATDGERPRLSEARVDRDRVLGYFIGRQEDEIVVDPRYLRQLRELPI
jgi:hypothetical protein